MLDFETEDVTDFTVLGNPTLVKLEADFVALLYLAFQPGTWLAVLGVTLTAISITSL